MDHASTADHRVVSTTLASSAAARRMLPDPSIPRRPRRPRRRTPQGRRPALISSQSRARRAHAAGRLGPRAAKLRHEQARLIVTREERGRPPRKVFAYQHEDVHPRYRHRGQGLSGGFVPAARWPRGGVREGLLLDGPGHGAQARSRGACAMYGRAWLAASPGRRGLARRARTAGRAAEGADHVAPERAMCSPT